MSIDNTLEGLRNLHLANKKPEPHLEGTFLASEFAFTAMLEAEWRTVRHELDSLAKEAFVPFPERTVCRRGWDIFGFYALGEKLHENCEKCPETARLLQQVRGISTAGFSCLKPGTHIRPHVGYAGDVLRCHLGLIIPDGCSMRVGKRILYWQEGRCLVFDDVVEHEVWHRGTSPRTVLLLDFARDAWTKT